MDSPYSRHHEEDRRRQDLRIGDLLGAFSEDSDDASVVLAGFPSDEGVRLNHGRVGAADGPRAIREALYRMTPDPEWYEPMIRLLGKTHDLGDLKLEGSLARQQETLGALLAPYLVRDTTIIVLGGGHETAFGHFLAYVRAETEVSILNWDAHPDVRPWKAGSPHSGSPFRQALEHASGYARDYTVAGLQPQTTAAFQLEYLKQKGARYVWATDINHTRIEDEYRRLRAPVLVSFDLDAVDAAFSPGVSAPAANGLSPGMWLYAAEAAGVSASVRSMDVVECNPAFDLDGRTARLGALTVWHFLRGKSRRLPR